MCGIAGFFGLENRNLLKGMLKTLKHRGPNDEGSFFYKNVALGNRRLSVIDIKTGHQPIHNENKKIWITFNGEIYNFMELRKKLGKKHKFYTKSDTEVIVHAYEEYGTNCVKKLNGMFAFAIWDSGKKQLFLARDRLGIKPLYYHWNGKKVVFASEIKALLQDKTIERAPDDEIIYEYLVYGLHDHKEKTFFKGIKRLLPAHHMIVNKKGIKIKKYWNLKVNRNFGGSSKKDWEYAKKFYDLFEESVKLRLISEVPLGTCFSGGIDSSSVVCVINKLLSKIERRDIIGKKQKTFSACYEDRKVDERKYINEVIKRLDIEKNYIFPSSKMLWKEIREFVYHQEEPVSGTSEYAQWNVFKLASKKVTVTLDGQGGDELLAGYIPYSGVYLLNLLKKRDYLRFLKEFFLSIDLTHPFIKEYLFMSKKETETKKMLNSAFVLNFEEKVRSKWKTNDFGDSLLLDTVKYSLPHLLRYGDKSSMAFSVEARVPFLDHRLVEYVFSLPLNQKIKNGWTKYVLRNAMKGVIPEKVRKRRSKIGFGTPQARWMRELGREIKKVFASKMFEKRKYFNQEEVLKKFDEFCKGGLDDYTRIFWRILNLEIWLETFFN